MKETLKNQVRAHSLFSIRYTGRAGLLPPDWMLHRGLPAGWESIHHHCLHGVY